VLNVRSAERKQTGSSMDCSQGGVVREFLIFSFMCEQVFLQKHGCRKIGIVYVAGGMDLIQENATLNESCH
jgi:hypothetical protein